LNKAILLHLAASLIIAPCNDFIYKYTELFKKNELFRLKF